MEVWGADFVNKGLLFKNDVFVVFGWWVRTWALSCEISLAKAMATTLPWTLGYFLGVEGLVRAGDAFQNCTLGLFL